MADDQQNMKLALSLMYDVQIIDPVDSKWFPHIPEGITQARVFRSRCMGCKKPVYLTHVALVEMPNDPKAGRYIYFCTPCAADEKLVAEARIEAIKLTAEDLN